MVPEEEEDAHEIEEEIEKQPLELDEMLELFRDDEEPTYRTFNPMWLILGLLIIVGGCWLMVVGVQAFTDYMSGLQGGGPKSAKASERTPEPARVADVAAAYRERCAKGMTKDEIRWILEDFEKAGIFAELEPLKDIISKVLDGKPERATQAERELLKKAILKAAARGREWYASALADGLMLNGDQKAELKQKLATALAKDTEEFEHVNTALFRIDEWIAKNGEPDERMVQELGEMAELAGAESFGRGIVFLSIASPELWVQSEAYAPWNLCSLSEDQLAVTNYSHVNVQHGENAAAGWLQAPEIKGEENQEITIPYFLSKPAGIFPLTPDQALLGIKFQVEPKDESIKAFIGLHPAQLKLALLIYPELANDLKQMLAEK